MLKYLGAFYLFVGFGSALILKAYIPALSWIGMTWYMLTWPYQTVAAQIPSLPIAPGIFSSLLFNL